MRGAAMLWASLLLGIVVSEASDSVAVGSEAVFMLVAQLIK